MFPQDVEVRTHHYRQGDGQNMVQYSTPGINGWLTTNGTVAERASVQSRHYGLIDHARDKGLLVIATS